MSLSLIESLQKARSYFWVNLSQQMLSFCYNILHFHSVRYTCFIDSALGTVSDLIDNFKSKFITVDPLTMHFQSQYPPLNIKGGCGPRT